MEDYAQNALKNGHSDPLRSVFALSDAACQDARFLLRTQADIEAVSIGENYHQLLAVARCGRS